MSLKFPFFFFLHLLYKFEIFYVIIILRRLTSIKLKLFQISSNKVLTNQDPGMSSLPTAYANEFEAAFCSFCIVKVL